MDPWGNPTAEYRISHLWRNRAVGSQARVLRRRVVQY